MKIKNIKLIFVIALISIFSLSVTAENENVLAETELLRLAVAPLTGEDVLSDVTTITSKAIGDAFRKTGLYYVLSFEEISNRASAVRAKMPKECQTSKCALDYAQLLACSKVITGSVVFDKGLYSMEARIFDVENRVFESRALVAAKCPKADLPRLAEALVQKLLNVKVTPNGITLIDYRGKEFFNKKDAIISAATAVVGAVVLNQLFAKTSATNKDLEHIDYSDEISANQSGAFANLDYGARPHGMGGAFVALADDAHAVLYNPAGMSRKSGRSFVSGFMNNFNLNAADVGFEGTGMVYPYSYIAHTNNITRTVSAGQAIITSAGGLDGLNENQIILSLAKQYDSKKVMNPFSMGLSAKFLMLSASPVENQYYNWQDFAVTGNAYGFSLDFGTQFQLTPRINAAIVLKDIYSSLSYNNLSTSETYTENLPASIVIGGHYYVLNSMSLVLDGVKSLYLDDNDKIHLGMEYVILDLVAIRMGLSQYFAYEDYRKFHGGFGIKKRVGGKSKRYIGVDYSFEYSTIDDSYYNDISGTHRFSVHFTK